MNFDEVFRAIRLRALVAVMRHDFSTGLKWRNPEDVRYVEMVDELATSHTGIRNAHIYDYCVKYLVPAIGLLRLSRKHIDELYAACISAKITGNEDEELDKLIKKLVPQLSLEDYIKQEYDHRVYDTKRSVYCLEKRK